MNDKAKRIHEHAYRIWEKEGRPEGRHEEHWFQAEREIGQQDSENYEPTEAGSDPHGIHAAEDYNRHVQNTVHSGKVEQAANDAKKAVEGPERESLRRAEEAGKRASKGNEAAGKR
jgi:hypothetical protein